MSDDPYPGHWDPDREEEEARLAEQEPDPTPPDEDCPDCNGDGVDRAGGPCRCTRNVAP